MSESSDWVGPTGSRGLVVVLTAMDVEYKAVRPYLEDVETYTHPTGTRFEIGALDGCPAQVALAVTGQGNGAAAIIAQQAISLFEPRAVFFVGIAGGLLNSVQLGDVVIGERVYNYHGGRDDPDGTKPRFHGYEAPHELLEIARSVARQGAWVGLLTEPAETDPTAHIALIVSGEVVLNSRTSPLAEQIIKFYPNAAAIDMESFGVAQAGFKNKVGVIAVRGISDHADGSKVSTDSGGWRVVAAERAAAFAVAFIRALPNSPTDPADQALELALLRAIRQYATPNNGLALAAPWLVPDGLRADPVVRAQLLQELMSPTGAAAEPIGRRWAGASGMPPDRDYTTEARVLIGYFRDQALRLGPLQRLRQAKVLDDASSVLESLDDTVDAGLAHVYHELAEVRLALTDAVELLGRAVFGGASAPAVRMYRYDQMPYLEEKARGFVGRRFVFQRIAEVLDEADRGYCFVLALPGVGKTALLSRLVKDEGYVHHFNIRTSGVTSPSTFLRNVCAELIAAYQLPHTELPPDAGTDSTFLSKLLGEAVAAANGRKVVVAIDALDEADSPPPGVNPLWLPASIPQGCFIVVTSRSDHPDHPDRPPRMKVDVAQFTVPIGSLSKENLDDVRDYIRPRADWPGIQAYRSRHHLDADGFVEHITAKSEGNFMYLHHVVPAIEKGEMTDRDLAAIPEGLDQYYEDHLELMRGSDEAAWFDLRLPVIAALAALPEPLTVDQIAALTGISSKPRIHEALRGWSQFLLPSVVVEQGRSHRAYSIYHAHYQEFLHRYASEAVSEIIGRIEEMLLGEYGGDE